MNVTNNKKYDNLCKAGCIISIVFSGIELFFVFLYSIIFFISEEFVAVFFILLFGLTQIFSILLCANVLKEKAKSHIAAGIVSLIFTGIIGGVLILVGKYEKENKDKK